MPTVTCIPHTSPWCKAIDYVERSIRRYDADREASLDQLERHAYGALGDYLSDNEIDDPSSDISEAIVTDAINQYKDTP